MLRLWCSDPFPVRSLELGSIDERARILVTSLGLESIDKRTRVPGLSPMSIPTFGD